jgi:hypothetical protein
VGYNLLLAEEVGISLINGHDDTVTSMHQDPSSANPLAQQTRKIKLPLLLEKSELSIHHFH